MPNKFYLKPPDRSLKTFKEWFQGYHGHKSAKEVVTRPWIDEAQWIAHWKMFWAKVDGSSSRKGPRSD